ncbi:MAG TPA: glycosyltransferase family 4 protein, partial [Acidimicrobiales bacterium]|nr:glycosyltransferase family 4 protein [Acidimicrobiales bacterium]
TVVASRACGIELVLHHHTFFYIHRRVGLMAAICRVGGRRLHHVFLCERMRDGFLQRYAVAGDSTVVSNAAFVPLGPAPGPRDRPGPLRVGMFGNLMAAKGLPDFLDVAARLHGDDRAELHVGGKVEPDMVAGLAAALDAGHVVHHGALYGEDKVAFLRGLDLLVFPSRYSYEAEPLVVWEAVGHGVPVVAYPIGCLGEQVSTSHLVDGVEELERWVRAFLADPRAARAVAAERHAAMAQLAQDSRDRFTTFVGARRPRGGPPS